MPIEIAPAISSAIPPKTTSFEFPRDERPAVKANGTVSPSERPMTLLQRLVSLCRQNPEGQQQERTHPGQYPDRRADVHPLQLTPYNKRRVFRRHGLSTLLARVRLACRDQAPHQQTRLGVDSCEWCRAQPLTVCLEEERTARPSAAALIATPLMVHVEGGRGEADWIEPRPEITSSHLLRGFTEKKKRLSA